MWVIIVAIIATAVLPLGLSGRSTQVTNRDIILVADLTQSVNALDGRTGAESTRLDDMKADMKQIANDQVGASIGIMTFSDRTDLYLPLTTGSDDIRSAIDTMYTAASNQSINKIVSYQEVFTKVGEYIEAQNQTDPSRERVVVFLSDFEVFKQQETNPEIRDKATAITSQGAGYVGLLYGSGQPVKMLNIQFNYLEGRVEPAHVILDDQTEGVKYYQDNYKTVFSTANPDLSEQIASQLGGTSIKTADSQDFTPAIESAAGKANASATQNLQSQATRQPLLYVVPALVGFIWLVSVEIIKPSWAMRRLNTNPRQAARKGVSS
jgi:hypothetical protein